MRDRPREKAAPDAVGVHPEGWARVAQQFIAGDC